MPLLLEGAVVRRVDLSEAVAAIEVRSPGETAVVLVGVARGVRGVGIVTSDARRAAWETRLPGGAARVRGGGGPRLDGGRIVTIAPRTVIIAHAHAHADADADAPAREDARACVAAEGARVVVRALDPSRGGPDAAEDAVEDAAEDRARGDYEARGAALLAALAEEAREKRREQIARAITRGLARVDRRIAATRGDLGRLADAEALAAQAQWLIAEAVRAPRGARSLKVTDWTSGEARVLEVPLDPSKPARAQVEAMFQRARRLKRGAKIAEERIAKAEVVRAALGAALDAARSAKDAAALDAAMARARAAAPKDVALDTLDAGNASGARGAGGSGAKPGKSAPYRTFVTSSGARLLVGKGAAQNDALTFQTARPHDLWLHAKGRTGAHVIVPLAKNSSCPADLLVDAAHLAAHFSDARDEAIVDVQYTPRRYLRKPRGSAPGFVVVDREKVIAVRLEAGRVQRMLDAEE